MSDESTDTVDPYEVREQVVEQFVETFDMMVQETETLVRLIKYQLTGKPHFLIRTNGVTIRSQVVHG